MSTNGRPEPSRAVEFESPLVPPILGYVRAIRSHLWVCVAIVLMAVVGAGAWMATHPAEYEASSHLLVTPLPDGDSSFLGLPMIRTQGADPQRAVTTAATLAESDEAIRTTAAQVEGGISQDAVDRAIEITPIEGENIVEITATATNAGRAAAIANAYAESVLAARQAKLRPLVAEAIARSEAELAQLSGTSARASELEARLSDLRSIEDGVDPTLAVAQVTGVPTAPEGPPRWLLLVVALIAGIALAATTAILIELLAPGAIGDEDDLRRAYPLPVLARVPRGSGHLTGSRRGPRLDPNVREAFRTLRGQLELRQSDIASAQDSGPVVHPLTGVVVITSPSTGDGKTTAALALAQATAASGVDVVVLESDLRKPDLARYLEVDPVHDLTTLLDASVELRDVTTRSPAADWLKFVAAPRIGNMSMIERIGALMPKLLRESADDHACIIVDTAALGEVSDALLVLPTADHVVVAVRLHHTTHAALASLRDSIERAGVRPAGFVVFDSPVAGFVGRGRGRGLLRRGRLQRSASE